MSETIADCFIGSAGTWCTTPSQSVNYASCHDNMTLFDRLQNSRPDASREDLIKMNNLAATIYITAQGIPFMQAGEEMLRTKVKEDGSFDHNSYASGDEVNNLKWTTLEDEAYMDVVNYYKGLIAFRKDHPILRLATAEEVNEHLTVVDGMDRDVTVFSLTGGIEGESADAMYIIFNPTTESTVITLPEGKWNVYINGEHAGTEVLDTVSGTVTVDAISAMVLVQEASGSSPMLVLVLVIAAIAIAAVVVVVIILKKKKNY